MISCTFKFSSFLLQQKVDFKSRYQSSQDMISTHGQNILNSFHFWVRHQKLWKKKNSMYSCYRDAAKEWPEIMKKKKTVCNVITSFCSKWLHFTFSSWLHINFDILEFWFLVRVRAKIFSRPHFDLNNWISCSRCDLWIALKAKVWFKGSRLGCNIVS